MKKLNVNTIPRGDLHVIHYPSKELKKKLKLVTPDIYILADDNNSWHSAGYSEEANEVGSPEQWLSETEGCNHYNPERHHRVMTIQCVAFMLKRHEHLSHCGPCHDGDSCIEGREMFSKA